MTKISFLDYHKKFRLWLFDTPSSQLHKNITTCHRDEWLHDNFQSASNDNNNNNGSDNNDMIIIMIDEWINDLIN